MSDDDNHRQIAERVLSHMYLETVTRSLRSLSYALGQDVAWAKNPKFQALDKLYATLGTKDRRLFYEAAAAIAEYVAYRMVDFVENYTRFDGEEGEGPFPRLSLCYQSSHREPSVTLTQGEEDAFGDHYLAVARSVEMRKALEQMIDSLVACSKE